jgi:PST family polysaccharide transporter
MRLTGRLGRNIFGLGVLQAVNLAVTFLTLPYLTRVLGVEAWGEIVFVLLIVNYGIWIMNWGFYLGATQRIAACRDSKHLVSIIACEVWLAQWLLASISIFVLSLYIVLIADQKMQPLYIAGLTILIGNLLTPLWFLHGLEKVWEASLVLLLAKVVILPFIFIFIDKAEDASLYLQLNGIGSVVVGVACLYWMHKRAFFIWSMPSIRNVLRVISEDAPIFLTSMIANLTSSIVPAAIGILSSPSDLGLFNIADRIKGAAITIFHPVVHALYPRMAYLFSVNKLEAVKLLRLSGVLIFAASLSVSVALFLLAPELVLLIGGKNFEGAISLLRVLSFVPLVSTVSAFIIHQVIIPLQEKRFYLISSIIILVSTLILVYPSIEYFGTKGAVMTILITELLGFFVLIFSSWLLRDSIGRSKTYV